jgi:hypothetical protein
MKAKTMILEGSPPPMEAKAYALKEIFGLKNLVSRKW